MTTSDKIISKDFFNTSILINEFKLAEISDRIWELGTLTEFKEKVCPDLFPFKDDNTYCDIINFMQNERLKIRDERLLKYKSEERIQMGGEIS